MPFFLSSIEMDKTALVLAGGGALGSYEIGAYEALLEYGYQFDIVTGTSIGALNGAYIAAGQFEDAKRLWNQVTPEIVMKDGVNISKNILKEYSSNRYKDLIRSGKSFIKNRFSMDNTPFKKYIGATLNVDNIINSKILFGICATRIPSFIGEEIVVNTLPADLVRPYLHASSACVPIFPMEDINGNHYIDGCYHDNLPIDFAFALGASKVIAVDLRLFSLKPLNSFYLNLPNVIYIAPYISLGSMMDFNHNSIMNNITLGYLDVHKHFKKYRGYRFCFDIKDISVGHRFLTSLIYTYGKKSKRILLKLSKGIRTPMDELDYFCRALELLLEKRGYKNYYQIIGPNDLKAFLENPTKTRSATVLGFEKLSPLLNSFLNRLSSEFVDFD